ncbi:sensor histidine kinase [Marinobacter sp. CA1]|uniref:sensor histidine kinase n=1 Tax=Marinobacter sp. CA1 TaxID=2817656 RepID=UPI001D0736F5|nr:ATP-binding protein [Marinobacter sp. CA1]MCG8519282.1 HAMP domain-containing histidine kinase [Pseudomonadales bacterium]UDL05259.1 sensor histidine kinase [Marinobacter sp. CA1]
MAKTLYTRLALGLFMLLVTVGVLYSVISWYSLRGYVTSVNQQLHRDLAANLVQDRNLVDEGRLNQAALKELFDLYMTINPSIEIYLLDPRGEILSYSADPAKIKRKRVSMAPIRALLADKGAYPILGDDPRSHERRKVFSVTPIPSARQPEGYLYVVLRGEEFDMAEVMARNGHFIEMSAWAVGIALTVGMLAGLAVFRLLTRRLSRLTGLVERFETADHGHLPSERWQQLRPQVRDEIDYLGVAFDRMAERIASQIDQLQEKDALRRRLVAQVSHDLRTPLASMQGYVESLRMKRQSLSEQEQEQFLDIALAEGRRLSRQVDELFELAALEAKEKRPQPEPFPLPELIHDVAQKHGASAAEKGITLAVAGIQAMPPAYGDLGMTERVLDNLIGNAIEYSPADSQVTLTLAQRDGQLELEVRDQGPGIPDADLPHVFDAFYRGDSGNAPGHAGLGLAIAKRIMTLQDGAIRVANRPSGGSAFTITLPPAH